MKDTDLAYFAGIIDGEGSISALFYREPGSNPKWSPRLRVKVEVYNTNILMIDWLKDNFGGVTWFTDRARARRIYHWQVTMGQAIPILTAAMPYFQVKRRQAEIVLELAGLSIPPGTARKQGIPPENMTRRVAFVEEMAKLNARWHPTDT